MGETDENKIVAQLAEMIARKYGVHETVVKRLYVAALLHDIGKLSLPDSIVNKNGRLTADEFNIMKTHTKLGAEMLKHIQGDLGVTARAVCLWHHEKWNGTGYWEKYSCDLPVGVSIVGIADTFVALCSSRSYKEAWTPTKAMEYISVYDVKMFRCLSSSPHTAHKTMRALYCALSGLLNECPMAVDFTSHRETDRLFLFSRYLSGCWLDYHADCRLIYISAWQCYVAKYP